mgnify:CR=1 FL=1
MMNRSLVYVVGLGPGGAQYLTAQAQTALQAADVLCGYTVYIDLVRPLYPDKEVYATGMTRELARCRWALETAKGGKTVALVCSGDAGVYGMASPLLELAEHCPEVEVEIVPGLTAALSGAAVLGAPLAHDFCVISLSDRLTPWAVIEKRLACAAAGDFCLALYNPSSKGRADYLQKAVRILRDNGKGPDTVCGLVRCIGRDGQTARLLTLAELEAEGRAAILIPSPNVAENHQYYNAMELQKAGAAVVIEEKDLTGEKLVQTVSGMLAQPGKLAEMGRNARSLSVDDSLDRIADALLKLVKTP